MPGEFDLIRRYFTRPRDARAPGVVLGVGDDAALLAPTPGMQIVATVDTLVSGVHFPADTPPADIGWKSLAVNLSDLAAMGAVPRACLLALTLPDANETWVEQFARGFFALADESGCALAGGDTTGGPLSITVTALGEVPAGAALTRGGARAGDLVCVSGSPGEAALGLARWQAARRAERDGRAAQGSQVSSDSGAAQDAAIARLLRPSPRLQLGMALRGIASACIDVSDGLLGDLAHIVESSSVLAGTALGADIDLAALPRSPLLLSLSDDTAREYILAGGDDYELCFTVPPAQHAALPAAAAKTGVAVTVIGRVTTSGELRCLDERGQAWQPRRRSWEHFRG